MPTPIDREQAIEARLVTDFSIWRDEMITIATSRTSDDVDGSTFVQPVTRQFPPALNGGQQRHTRPSRCILE